VGVGNATLTLLPKQSRLRFLSMLIVGILTALALPFMLGYLHSPSHGLPYQDSFSGGHASEWRALGGTWAVVNGVMRNDSDERGAKLITGSTYWRNYSIEADVMLLGQDGDAGLIIRSSDEEEGVDSYQGYYAGLRNRDNSLVLGHADHGWMETLKYPDPRQGGIQAFQWYHLKLLAYECQIAASATSPSQGTLTTAAIIEKDCVTSGRVGLRSYASGGAWKNIAVRPATHEDLTAMLASIPSHEGFAIPSSPAVSGETPGGPTAAPGKRPLSRSTTNTQPIDSLRLSSFSNPTTATVRGVVILTYPALFVQDSTGGVSVPHPNAPPLKIGDEVEVTGEVHPGDFSSTLEHATVRVLWARNPVPAVSVSASQAATGAFDENFIELEGSLRTKSYGPDNTLQFDFDSGPQAFRAIMNRGRGDVVFENLKVNSLVRLRGICVVDPAYTRNLTPFVLLLRSSDDLKVLAGPPWWSIGNLVATLIGLLALASVSIFLHSRIENWRLRAVMGERERLAHEMHDTLAQSFAGIGFQLEAVRNGIPADMRVTHHQLDLASDLVNHSHEEARRSIAILRPEPLQTGNLLAALESCAHKMVEGGAVQVVATCNGDLRAMPLRTTDTLYRIGQEAIANAVRHARPTTITISLEYQKNVVHMVVADDGTGFTQSGNLRGFGLRGMRKRAAAIHAELEILSTPGLGTHVRITASLPPRITIFSWPQFLWKYVKELTNVQYAGR
jgi:signal transduction histidine kinase